jgi:hypothetical protein
VSQPGDRSRWPALSLQPLLILEPGTLIAAAFPCRASRLPPAALRKSLPVPCRHLSQGHSQTAFIAGAGGKFRFVEAKGLVGENG